MLTLAERHQDRIKRKALAVLKEQERNGQITRGGNAEEEGPFVMGADADGFDLSGIGTVNSDIAGTTDPAKVVQVKGQTNPIQGAVADAATSDAQAMLDAQNEAAAKPSDAPPVNDSHLAWGSTAKGVVPGMPEGSKAQAKAAAAADSGDKPAS